jgi:hypothetical protein
MSLRSESGADVTVFKPAIIVATSFCNSNSNEVADANEVAGANGVADAEEDAIYILSDSPFRRVDKFIF